MKVTRYTKSEVRCPRKVTKRSFKFFSREEFLRDLVKVTWFNIYMSNDTDEASSLLTKKIVSVLDEHAPIKSYQVRKNFAPWLTKETKAKMKERDAAQREARITKDVEDIRLYRNLRNQVTMRLKKDKRYWEEKKLKESESDPAALWGNVKT